MPFLSVMYIMSPASIAALISAYVLFVMTSVSVITNTSRKNTFAPPPEEEIVPSSAMVMLSPAVSLSCLLSALRFTSFIAPTNCDFSSVSSFDRSPIFAAVSSQTSGVGVPVPGTFPSALPSTVPRFASFVRRTRLPSEPMPRT